MEDPRILVVDDDAMIRFYESEYLRVEGFIVDEAADGDKAAKMVDARLYVLILTDVSMPGILDGIGLARYAKAHYPNLPILFCTARPQLVTMDDRSDSNTVVLTKPVSPKIMVSTIREMLAAANIRLHPATS